MITSGSWTILRAVLFASGLTLLGYVLYRYTLVQPPSLGSLYDKIFPLFLLLALSGISLAEAPLRGLCDLVHRVSGHVFLPLAVAVLAWRSAALARWMGAEDPRPVRVGQPALGVTGD